MPKITANGLEIHYQQLGEGPDIVLVHGITASLAMWYMRIGPALADRCRVTMYDLRGHGYSGMPAEGYTTADMAQDLDGLLDQLEIRQAFLLGHSYGGAVALHFAALHPERVAGVIVADAGVPALLHLRTLEDWPGWDEWEGQLEQYGLTRDTDLDDVDPGEVIRRSLDVPVQFGLRKGRQRKAERITALLDRTSVMADFRQAAGLDEKELGNVRCPTLALYGAHSIYRQIGARLKELLPHCATLWVQGSGHFYLVERPEILLEPARRFLDDPIQALDSFA